MKVFVSEKFGYLKEWIYDIARSDALPQGECLYDKRNRIIRVVIGNEAFVIKRFGRPTAFNRIVYSFFRRTKAERAYRNAEKLREMGYDSPEPVAYIELRSFGVFKTGYYICRWSPNPIIAEMSGGGEISRNRMRLWANWRNLRQGCTATESIFTTTTSATSSIRATKMAIGDSN